VGLSEAAAERAVSKIKAHAKPLITRIIFAPLFFSKPVSALNVTIPLSRQIILR
jgi:hypothetical protein